MCIFYTVLLSVHCHSVTPSVRRWKRLALGAAIDWWKGILCPISLISACKLSKTETRRQTPHFASCWVCLYTVWQRSSLHQTSPHPTTLPKCSSFPASSSGDELILSGTCIYQCCCCRLSTLRFNTARWLWGLASYRPIRAQCCRNHLALLPHKRHPNTNHTPYQSLLL